MHSIVPFLLVNSFYQRLVERLKTGYLRRREAIPCQLLNLFWAFCNALVEKSLCKLVIFLSRERLIETEVGPLKVLVFILWSRIFSNAFTRILESVEAREEMSVCHLFFCLDFVLNPKE